MRRVELEDLLGREPVWIEKEHVGELLGDRVVMVPAPADRSGGAVPADRALPARGARLFEHSEAALYGIAGRARGRVPGDRDAARGRRRQDTRRSSRVLSTEPDVVFHAAAYKHVPLMEETNAWQAVRNNAYGTWVLATPRRVARGREVRAGLDRQGGQPDERHGRDQAPGGDRLPEPARRQRARSSSSCASATCSAARGSVIPRFREQIARGGPVTVTHPDITRFFMSLSEATQLLLQAALQGRGGEIFVLDMGEPVRIVDLARDMIRLSGLIRDRIAIVFTGLRPGEKLYEETIDAEEATLPTPHPKLHVAQACHVEESLLTDIVRIIESGQPLSDHQSRELLMRWVPGYTTRRPRGSFVAYRR